MTGGGTKSCKLWPACTAASTRAVDQVAAVGCVGLGGGEGEGEKHIVQLEQLLQHVCVQGGQAVHLYQLQQQHVVHAVLYGKERVWV